MEIQFATLELNQRLLEAIQQMWRRELGIEVTLANKEQRVWLNDERQLNYDISYAHWIGDYVDPSTYLELFTSDGGNNSTGWANPEYDRLVQTAGAELDPARALRTLPAGRGHAPARGAHRADLFRHAGLSLPSGGEKLASGAAGHPPIQERVSAEVRPGTRGPPAGPRAARSLPPL